MKISIIGSRGYPYVYSGYETFVKEISERLVRQGIEITVYCHAYLFKDKPKEVNGIKLVYVPTIKSKSLSQLSNSFLAILHACLSNTDLILVVNSANGPFGILTRMFNKPSAINVDGLEWLRPKWKGLGAKYFKWASLQATKHYDQIINDSDEMRNVYLKVFQKDSAVIAYGAKIRHRANPELITRWNIEENEYYLIVGRLIPDNNADLIVEGFLASDSKRKLVVVGDVPYKDAYAEKIKAVAEKDSRLIFTGYVTDPDELAELYHNCYGYVHGHEFGGTNPTMLKAMAYGTAILALDTPFNREMLQSGKFGKFFSKETSSVKTLIEFCDSNPHEIASMKEQSREGITKKYDWDEVTGQYLKLFKELTR